MMDRQDLHSNSNLGSNSNSNLGVDLNLNWDFWRLVMVASWEEAEEWRGKSKVRGDLLFMAGQR